MRFVTGNQIGSNLGFRCICTAMVILGLALAWPRPTDRTQLVDSRKVSVTTPPQASRPQLSKSIEQIRVGDRVQARNPEVSDSQRDEFIEPDSKTWGRVLLEMPKDEGGVLTIDMIRPLHWLREHQADPGSSIELDLAELGASGPATVRARLDCPPIDPGSGHVVTATFRHPPSHAVLQLQFEGDSQALGVTDNHPFWSVDRERFVEAGTLSKGERVLTHHGQTKQLVSRLPRPGSQFVYNIEVHGEHVYHVGEQGLLVHNSCSKPRGGRYGDIRRAHKHGEVHHMPASAVSPYTHYTGPAILMTKRDHRRTASWGSSNTAKQYRQQQADLIAKGRIREAVQMDIDDIRDKFDDKYDDAIDEMLAEFGDEF